jgi:hypothetical protein
VEPLGRFEGNRWVGFRADGRRTTSGLGGYALLGFPPVFSQLHTIAMRFSASAENFFG